MILRLLNRGNASFHLNSIDNGLNKTIRPLASKYTECIEWWIVGTCDSVCCKIDKLIEGTYVGERRLNYFYLKCLRPNMCGCKVKGVWYATHTWSQTLQLEVIQTSFSNVSTFNQLVDLATNGITITYDSSFKKTMELRWYLLNTFCMYRSKWVNRFIQSNIYNVHLKRRIASIQETWYYQKC